MNREFDRGEVRALLGELRRRLEARGIRGDVRIVGGAAVAFTCTARRRTKRSIQPPGDDALP